MNLRTKQDKSYGEVDFIHKNLTSIKGRKQRYHHT